MSYFVLYLTHLIPFYGKKTKQKKHVQIVSSYMDILTNEQHLQRINSLINDPVASEELYFKHTQQKISSQK